MLGLNHHMQNIISSLRLESVDFHAKSRIACAVAMRNALSFVLEQNILCKDGIF